MSRLLSRRLVALLGTFAISTWSRLTQAEDASVSVAEDEIYLEAQSGRLAAPLPYGKPLKIVIIVPAASTATLTIADSNADTCPKTLAEGDVLAGAPVGGPVAGRQKLLFKTKKLFPHAQYCFQVATVEQRNLSTTEQGHLASALVGATRGLVRQRLDGLPATVEQQQACARLGAPAPAGNAIRPCELAFETAKLLPAGLSELQIYYENLRRALSFEEALYQELLNHQGALLGAAQLLTQALANAGFAASAYDVAMLSATSYSATLGARDPIYDPIPEVTAAALCATLNGAAAPGTTIKNDLCGAGILRPTFVTKLYQHRVALTPVAATVRTTALAAPAEGVLLAFLGAPREAKLIDLGAAALAQHLKILANLNRTSDKLSLVNDLLPKLEPLASAVGWRDFPAPANLLQLQGLLKDVKELRRDLLTRQEAEQLEQTLRDHDAFKAFVAQFGLKRVYLGGGGMSSAQQGTTEDLFPFYASLDVGAAALGFAGDRWSFGQYFGVNFYLRAVDPSEPLYSGRGNLGRGLGRRLSITLGITTNGASIKEARGVDGIVGSQMLLVGGGVRVLEFLRLSGGSFWFFKDDSNPLKNDPHLRAGGYAGVSLDLAAFTLISAGYTKLTTGKD